LVPKGLLVVLSASNDGVVVEWEVRHRRQTRILEPRRWLEHHTKAVHALAYCSPYHCLLSAGCEQQLFMWPL
jgi:hypothetical protein